MPERETAKGVREEINDRQAAEAEMHQGLAAGMLKFRRYGHKREALICRRPTRGLGKKESWLLIKHADGSTQAGYDANAYDISEVSGRSLAEIAREPPGETYPLRSCSTNGKHR